jgi:hypothetical protein
MVTTNLFFPDAVNAEVYASAPYDRRGRNPVTVGEDVELKGDTARFNALMLDISREAGGRYVGTYTFGIDA